MEGRAEAGATNQEAVIATDISIAVLRTHSPFKRRIRLPTESTRIDPKGIGRSAYFLR
jgi:hypothetical protein